MNEQAQKILVVDDEAGMRNMLRLVLEKEGYVLSEAGTAQLALDKLGAEKFDLVLCDIRMPELDGIGFLEQLKLRRLAPTVVMMSAYGSLDTAIECLKKGAYDYISKPFKPDEVLLTLKKAEERLRLLRENALLKKQLGQPDTLDDIVFQSPAMEQLLDLVERAAQASSPALITGETGTGKELIARALHYSGPRASGPFLAVNCSAIAASLLESELFGHAKGAFTGADRAREGLFLAANGGTLFLDEIGELPLELQPKLLRVLQEGEVRRVGEAKPRKIDVKVVAATARDLHAEAEEGRFRLDLFFRLAVVELQLPPLRERRVDIPLLADYFMKNISHRDRRQAPELSDAVVEKLKSYHWPGNVRELENFMEKTLIFCRGERIELDDLPWDIRRQERRQDDELSLKKAVDRLEGEYIRKALTATGGNRTQAAKVLEISLRALHYKLKDLELD